MQIFQEVLTLIGICWLKVLFNLSLSDSNDVAMQNSIYSMAAGLMFVKLHLNETSRTMSFGQTRSKWRCKALMHSTIFGENKTPHTSCGVWRWGGGGWFGLVLKPQDLGTFQSSSWPQTPWNTKVFLRPSVCQLKHGWNWIMQLGKIKTKLVKKKRLNVMQWSRQSPDLNLTEVLQWELCINKCLQTSISWSRVG